MTLEQRLAAFAQAVAAKFNTLPSGGGGGAVIKTATLAIGWPAKTSGSVIVSDAAISAASKVMVMGGEASDEAELQGVIRFDALAQAGQMTVYWSSGTPQGGDLKIKYLIG